MKKQSDHPMISVIIPTFNRAELLEQSLRSLVKQSLSQKHYEVVVIDDGSKDHTREICKKMERALPLRYYCQENSGIAVAKNLGIFISRAPILFFFDDDDVADKELLREHLKTHQEHSGENIAVLGYTTWSPTLKISQVMHFVTDIGHFLFSYTLLKDEQELDYTYFWGGRSSCKRSLLVKQGIFNPTFRFGSEDIELGYRLSKFGLRVLFNKNAVTYMIRPITYDEFCKRCERQGRSQYVFSQLHPDPFIQQYCMSIKAEEKWQYVEKTLEEKVKRVHEMEALVASGVSASTLEGLLSELGNLYWWTFNAFKIKGIVEEGRSRKAESIEGPEKKFPVSSIPQDNLNYFHKKWRSLPIAPKEKQNILVIDPFLPMFDRASGSLRLFQILKSLVKMNDHVTFIARDGVHANRYLPTLRDLGIEAYAGDPSALEASGMNILSPYLDLEKILSERTYKVVILDFWNLAEYYLPLIRKYSPTSKVVVDSVDIHFLREIREAEMKGDEKLKARALQNKEREIALYKKADRVWVVTPDDKKAIESLIPGIPIDIIPNVHEKIDYKKIYSATKDLLFVGNFNHRPNIDAVLFLCEEIFPSILKELNDVKLFVVGNNPPDEIKTLSSTHITVTGYVEDLTPYLRNARISVNPLRYGAGMKGKIGEALSWGLPVVTTSIGAEGMELVNGQHVLVADTSEDFAAQVVGLYRDELLWNQLSVNGKCTVESRWSPEAIQKKLQSVFGEMDSRGEKVSIVILTFNELEYTKKCFESIQSHTPEPHEIIFVDNGSTDGSVKWLRRLVHENRDCQLIENGKNLGFAKGCNQGIRISTGEYILLLNNDVIVTEGWLGGMLRCLKSASGVGIVGPMTNYISGPQRAPSSDYGSINRLEEYARSFRERNRDRRIPVKRIVGFCMLFRRELMEKIGLLDEQFGSGNFEDDDFCLRAALEGYQNLIAGDVFIHHYGSRSFVGNKIDYMEALSRNRKIFQKKWEGVDAKDPLGMKLLTIQTMEKASELNQKDKANRALEILFKGIARFPDERRFYGMLSELLIDAKQFQEALEVLNKMPSEDNDIWKLERTGYCKEGLERYEEAEEIADTVLSLHPGSSFAWNLKGMVAYKKGDKERAGSLFKKAMMLDPNYGEPYTNLGVLKWTLDEKSEALDLLERGVILCPTMTDGITTYHLAITATGEFERAERIFREAKALYPLNRRITFLLIDVLIQQGKKDAAMSEIEEAMINFGIDQGILSAALEIRSGMGAMEIGPASKGTLSLCMILKNEEKNLPRSLMNVKPIVDEIIVVDTGSTDRTREIARVFGAKVYDYEWADDFSGARNFSLSKAKGSWVLILDADEVISPVDHSRVTKIIKEKNTQPVAYSLTTRNYVELVNTSGWTANDGRYKEEAGAGWFPGTKVRLFPNGPRIHFEHPVHEMVEPSLRKAGIKIKECTVPIHHYGKLSMKRNQRKGEEYFLLGKKKLEERGDDFPSLYELAVQAGEIGAFEEAVKLWQKCIELQPENPKAHFNLGYSYLELGRYEEALLASARAMELAPGFKEAVFNYSLCEFCVGDIQKTITVLEDLIVKETRYPFAIALLSAAYLIEGKRERGFETLGRMKSMGYDGPAFLHSLAERLICASRMDAAVSLLERAIETQNMNDQIVALLAQCKNPSPFPSLQRETVSQS